MLRTLRLLHIDSFNFRNVGITMNLKQKISMLFLPFVFIIAIACLVLDVINTKTTSFHYAYIPLLLVVFWWIKRAVMDRVSDKYNLIERNKELTCLYSIAALSYDQNKSVKEHLQTIAELLPPAFQFPDIVYAKLSFDQQSFFSSEKAREIFKTVEPTHILSIDINVERKKRGLIQIFYDRFSHHNKTKKLNFLKEELKLLQTIIAHLGPTIARKEAEFEKKLLQDQLRHADRLATIGQLAAGVAHELNEPLANILGFAQLAQKTENISSQVYSDLENIVTASLHAREVIKKLMLFGRQMPPQDKKTNINKLVKDGLFFIESRCNKSGIEVARNLSPTLPEINADPSQLYQVLINLTVNAEQAMSGGGTLTVETKYDQSFVYLIVKDTGIGMTPEIVSQIFIPFFTTKDVNQGTGLGLAVVHGIIAAHRGSIAVDSTPNLGTTFTVSLPIAPKEEKPS